jgi:deazaflavin-dependent oxidoreductase (nitroreductase family)
VTGKPRTVALMYATDGEDLVVVGSNGGADQPPEWLENIRANGHVALQVKRERFAATADVVDQNDRRYERLWRLVNTAAHGRYYHYQQATTRPIPVVVLSRANEDA